MKPPQVDPGLLQAAEKRCFVSGHDFSRAVTAAKSGWALAPATCCSGIRSEIRPFSAACLVRGFRVRPPPAFRRPGPAHLRPRLFDNPASHRPRTLVRGSASNQTRLQALRLKTPLGTRLQPTYTRTIQSIGLCPSRNNTTSSSSAPATQAAKRRWREPAWVCARRCLRSTWT